ncbi:hypothetical protein JCM10213_006588 [Rhodosporidiobolus nylandii]
MDDPEPAFDSPTAALTHYRQLCSSLQSQLQAAEQDIADFTESSKELQGELEKELERVEKAERDLRREWEEERGRADEWKSKYTKSLSDHTATMAHMQRELEGLRRSERELRDRLRDVEMDNDEMEKSGRETSSSLADAENRYNKSLERIALLEEELVSKAAMEEEVQRLKDELRDVNEELAITRASAPAAASQRGHSPLPSGSPSPVCPTATLPPPVASLGSPPSFGTPRRTPSPSTRSPPPAIELIDPTPLPPRTLPSHLAASSSGAAPPASPAYRAPLTPGVTAGPLSRSTRVKHLHGQGLPSSPSSPNFGALRDLRQSTTSGIPSSPSTQRFPSTPAKTPALARVAGRANGMTRTDTQTMIRDMQQMTSRVRELTSRLDQRRTKVMAGSAIPRASMSPSTSNGGLSRSATVRGVSGLARPRSRLGERAGEEGGRTVQSTRPPSRSALRQSLHGGSSIPLPGRPPSRLSSTSASSSRPLTPTLPSRSPTPTSSRPAWGSSAAAAQSALSKSTADRRRASSSYGAAGLSKSVHGRTTSGSSAAPPLPSGAGIDLGATVRRPPSSLGSSRPASAASSSTTASKRSSAGLGLGASMNGLARSVIGRRVSRSGEAPPLPQREVRQEEGEFEVL